MKYLKRIIVLIFLFVISLSFAKPILLAEDVVTTTEITTTTEEVTTTIDEENSLDNLFNTDLIDSVAPTIQLVLQIASFIYALVVTYMAISGKFKEMMAKKQEQKANNQLTIEQKLRQVQMSQLTATLDILNIIVQNSKLPTADKISINELIANNKQQVDEVIDLAAQLTDLDSNDISDLIKNLTDAATLIGGGIKAFANKDISDLEKAVEKTKETGD